MHVSTSIEKTTRSIEIFSVASYAAKIYEFWRKLSEQNSNWRNHTLYLDYHLHLSMHAQWKFRYESHSRNVYFSVQWRRENLLAVVPVKKEHAPLTQICA